MEVYSLMKTKLYSNLWNAIPIFMIAVLIGAVLFTVCLDIIYGNTPIEEVPVWVVPWIFGK